MSSYITYHKWINRMVNDWNESDHPRDETGKFTDGNGSAKSASLTPSDKKASVKIDFTKDNVLPKLNPDTIETLGPDADKPVLFKKHTIERNQAGHPEVKPEDYNEMIGAALYEPDIVTPGNASKPYHNFIAGVRAHKSPVVLLEVDCHKGMCEIVHLHWVHKKARESLIKKGEKIKKDG